MACNVCGEVGLINCDKCSGDLGDNFYCFDGKDDHGHFCSGLCFEQWIVEQHQNNLEEAEEDGT